MGRTILRTANTSDVNDISESFANFATFNGINDSNNFVSVDQNSFEDANNVYVDNHDELSTRPPMLAGIANIVFVKYVGNTIVYKTYIESTDTYQYELFFNDTSYLFDAVKDDNFYYIDGYYVIVSESGIKVYTWDNTTKNFTETDIDNAYTPIVTIKQGTTSTSNEGYNLINTSYIVRYIMNSEITTDTIDIEGKTVTVTIGNDTYNITWHSYYTTTALEQLREFSLITSQYDKYMVSDLQTMVFYNYTNNMFYYSIDGKSFATISAPRNDIDGSKLGMCLSDDGTALYCTYSFDVNITQEGTDNTKYNSVMYYIALSIDESALPINWNSYQYSIYNENEISNYPCYNNVSRRRSVYIDDELYAYANVAHPLIGDFTVSYADDIKNYTNMLFTTPIMHSPNYGSVVVMARVPCLCATTEASHSTNVAEVIVKGAYLQTICYTNDDGYIEMYPSFSTIIQDTCSTLYNNEAEGLTEADECYVISVEGTAYNNYEINYPEFYDLFNFQITTNRVTLNSMSKIRLITSVSGYFVTVLYRYAAHHKTLLNSETSDSQYRLDVSYSITVANSQTLSDNISLGGNTYNYSYLTSTTTTTSTKTHYWVATSCFNACYTSAQYCGNVGTTNIPINFIDEYANSVNNTLQIKIGVLAGSNISNLLPYTIYVTVPDLFTERYTNAINICSRNWHVYSTGTEYIIPSNETGLTNPTYIDFTMENDITKNEYSYRYPLGFPDNAEITVTALDNDSAGYVTGIVISKDLTSYVALTNNYLYDYSTDTISSYIIWQRNTTSSSSYVTNIPLYVDSSYNILYLKADTYFNFARKGWSLWSNNWTTDWYIDVTYDDYDATNMYNDISYIANLNISGATSTIAVGNYLYQTQFRDDSLYIDVTSQVDINDTITALVVFNQTTIGVFTINTAYEYTYDTDNAAWYLYPTKLQLGIDIGYNIIIGYDASTLYTCNQLGLCALTYENFVQSDEHIYTRLSDNIYSKYYRDYNTNPIKVEKYLHWIILYNSTNVVWLYDIDAKAWWKWTLPFTVDLIWTWQQVLYFATYDSDTSLYTAYIVDFDSDDFYDYGTEVIDWNFKSQKLHFNYPNNYKHIRRISIVTTQNTEKIRYKLKFTNYKSWEQIQDKYVVEYDIDDVNTLIQKINFMKCNAFQFEISNDTTWKYPRKFVVSNIAIKYRVTEDIR